MLNVAIVVIIIPDIRASIRFDGPTAATNNFLSCFYFSTDTDKKNL